MNPLLIPNTARNASNSADAKFITCYNPSTGSYIATVPADDAYGIRQKIGQAGAAQRHWKTSTSDERRRVLKSIERWLLDNKDLCARIASTVERKEYLFAVPTMLRVCYDVEKMIMLFLR